MKHGTLLRVIASHNLWVECRACGHGAELRVSELLELTCADAAVRDILPRLKCTRCRQKQIGDVRILSPDVSSNHHVARQPAEQHGVLEDEGFTADGPHDGVAR
ncbi:hypothetical protein [Ruegeria sp. HKCCD8929]|uniref:hypothetical protein n=1 Tax=Ruegeria sp. HKCCD8929 TaxID=2683006 RepID=UPI001489C075|nr:hypothetical protein [Ruegeria sp. HKCCD8929]